MPRCEYLVFYFFFCGSFPPVKTEHIFISVVNIANATL